MSTDRELLEAAARAAGIDVLWPVMREGAAPMGMLASSLANTAPTWWSPLQDDADAFRLAVALDLNVSHWGGSVNVNKPGRGPVHAVEHWGPDGDKAAATRRAIVRAAAALART